MPTKASPDQSKIHGLHFKLMSEVFKKWAMYFGTSHCTVRPVRLFEENYLRNNGQKRLVSHHPIVRAKYVKRPDGSWWTKNIRKVLEFYLICVWNERKFILPSGKLTSRNTTEGSHLNPSVPYNKWCWRIFKGLSIQPYVGERHKLLRRLNIFYFATRLANNGG